MRVFNRRDLLLSGAATGALLLSGCETSPAPPPPPPGPGTPGGGTVPPTPPPPTPPATTTFMRRNIHELASNDPIVEAYRTGVAVMKSRSTNDPTSWQYQANMHGTASAPPSGALWNMCRHGSGQFLPWHRMYIYFFERIVRAASGNPDFALPFWDYSSPGQAMLPGAFRTPANATNSLWNGSRNGSVNAGSSLPFSTFTAANSMGFDQFLPAGFVPAFGSGDPNGNSSGQLEFQPHNVVHVAIGGDMGHPFTAGNDPIFWLHHCNVDRLWSAWEPLAGGRTNPTNNAAWMNQTFDFFDENGTRITMSNAEILDTSTMGGLGYIYDSFDFQGAKGSPEAGPAVGVPTAESGAIALGSLKTDVDLEPSIGMQSASGSNQMLSSAKHAALVLEGVAATGDVGVYYEIYLNLPDGVNPDPNGMHYVGVLDYFSAQSGGHGHHGGDTSTKRYEVGRILKQQNDAGIFTDLTVAPKLTFIANGMAPTQGGALQVNTAAQPVIGSSRIETAQ